jgi:hypothetical protein
MPPASAPVTDIRSIVYVSHSKAAGYMGIDRFAFVAHTRRLPVGRWVVSRFGDVRFGSSADMEARPSNVRFASNSQTLRIGSA